jgi:16S rRNA C1402 (ribose-2'-O) methylase RsmI
MAEITQETSSLLSEDPRSVDIVIKKLLEIIPEEEFVLIAELKKYYDTLWNQSPEALKSSYCWIPLQNIMNEHVPYLDEPWKKKAIRMFNKID